MARDGLFGGLLELHGPPGVAFGPCPVGSVSERPRVADADQRLKHPNRSAGQPTFRKVRAASLDLVDAANPKPGPDSSDADHLTILAQRNRADHFANRPVRPTPRARSVWNVLRRLGNLCVHPDFSQVLSLFSRHTIAPLGLQSPQQLKLAAEENPPKVVTRCSTCLLVRHQPRH